MKIVYRRFSDVRKGIVPPTREPSHRGSKALIQANYIITKTNII